MPRSPVERQSLADPDSPDVTPSLGADLDRAFYDEQQIPAEGEWRRWLKGVARAYDATERWLASYLSSHSDLSVLDLGAGSCCMSLLLSRHPAIHRIACLDISTKRMESWSRAAQAVVGGDARKLTFVQGDFNQALPFERGQFDIVLTDGALHHARSIWGMLREIHLVLKPQGVYVAQRECFLSPLLHGLQLRRILKSDEVRSGVSENAYLRSQYDYYLRAMGFVPQFHPYYPDTLRCALGLFNGVLFSSWLIVAARAATRSVSPAD